MSGWTLTDMPDQSGKCAIVTGANTGLGFHTALGLAGAGAHVVVTARDEAKGRDAVARIQASHPGAWIELALLDLADLRSVSDFAAAMQVRGTPIDLLINNAGVMAPRVRLTTADGFELQFGVNFLGHFALTGHLLPLILQAPAPRVVSLASVAHRYGRIDFANLMSDRPYSPARSYAQSKLAMLMYARELQRHADAAGWPLRSIAAHPGVAFTELFSARPGQPVLRINRIGRMVAPLFMGTPAGGALATLYAATSPDAEGGGYYGPTGWREIKGPPGPAGSTEASRDPEVARRLWERAEEYTGVRY